MRTAVELNVVISKITPGVSRRQEQALEMPETIESTSLESARGARTGTMSSRVARGVITGSGTASRFFFFGTRLTVVAVTVTVESYEVTVSVVVAMMEVPAYAVERGVTVE